MMTCYEIEYYFYLLIIRLIPQETVKNKLQNNTGSLLNLLKGTYMIRRNIHRKIMA